MTSQLPIACSLSAAGLPQRLAEMRAIGETSFIGTEINARRALIRFRERAGNLELEIVAPDGAEVSLADFVGAFSGRQRVPA